MKFRATYLWAAIVLSLVGYSYWDYRKNKGAPDLQSGEQMAFTIKRDDVKHVVFTRGDVTVELERKDDEWHMLKPIGDIAEDSVVDGFLFGIMGEKLRAFREDADAPDWAKYGLKPPGVTVELGSDKAKEKIEVSTKSAFDGSFYVRRGDEVLAGSTSLAQSTNREANSFRTKRIWRHADADVSKVIATYDKSGPGFTFTREKGAWAMEPKPKFGLDPERIDKWINVVQDLSANEIVRDGVDDLDPSLKTPHLTVAMDYQAPNEKPGRWELKLGAEKGADDLFYTNDRPAVLKTTAASVRKLFATPEYFRDGHEPFKFDAEAARTVEVKSPKVTWTAKRDGVTWALVGGKPDQSLDEAAFRDFIATLGGLKAADFPGSAVKVKGAPAVRVLDGAGKVLFALTLGDDYASKAAWNDGAKVRAVTATAGETFGLPKGQIDTLITDKIVKTKTAPAKPAAESPPSK